MVYGKIPWNSHFLVDDLGLPPLTEPPFRFEIFSQTKSNRAELQSRNFLARRAYDLSPAALWSDCPTIWWLIMMFSSKWDVLNTPNFWTNHDKPWQTHTHTCMHACIRTYVCTYMHTYMHTSLTLPYSTLPYITLPYLALPCVALRCITYILTYTLKLVEQERVSWASSWNILDFELLNICCVGECGWILCPMVLLLDNCRIHVTLGLVSAHSPKAGNHQSRIAFLEKALDDFPSNSHVRGFSSHVLTPEMVGSCHFPSLHWPGPGHPRPPQATPGPSGQPQCASSTQLKFSVRWPWHRWWLPGSRKDQWSRSSVMTPLGAGRDNEKAACPCSLKSSALWRCGFLRLSSRLELRSRFWRMSWRMFHAMGQTANYTRDCSYHDNYSMV